MEIFDKIFNEFSEIQLNVDQMNKVRGGDAPINPPEPPSDPIDEK